MQDRILLAVTLVQRCGGAVKNQLGCHGARHAALQPLAVYNDRNYIAEVIQGRGSRQIRNSWYYLEGRPFMKTR